MHLIAIPGAELYFAEHFHLPAEATQFFKALMSKCAWERRKTRFGNDVPRDGAFYGDPGTDYTYSGRTYKPLPWMPELLALRTRVEAAIPDEAFSNLSLARTGFNAVLCNRYLDGRDNVPLHADDEPETGSVIPSISLGAERLFRLRRKDASVVFSERLIHGSLLIMAGDTQKNFRHEVPKEPGVTLPRINLTFRCIF